MTSRHAEDVPLNVRVIENSRAAQNRWFLARAKKPLTLRGNRLAGRSYTAKNRGARLSLRRLSASVPLGAPSGFLTGTRRHFEPSSVLTANLLGRGEPLDLPHRIAARYASLPVLQRQAMAMMAIANHGQIRDLFAANFPCSQRVTKREGSHNPYGSRKESVNN
jgi:hypothetical protein